MEAVQQIMQECESMLQEKASLLVKSKKVIKSVYSLETHQISFVWQSIQCSILQTLHSQILMTFSSTAQVLEFQRAA